MVAGGTRMDNEAFVRSLICDKVSRHRLGSYTKSEFLLEILGYVSQFLTQFFTDSDHDQAGSSILSEYWNFYLCGRGLPRPPDAEESKENVMQSWMHTIFDHI